MSITPIRLLIFDLDGTIVDTVQDIAASINHTLITLGRGTLPLDAVKRYVGDGLDMMLTRSLGGDAGLLPTARKIYFEHHRMNLIVQSSLYPGVTETLEYFKSIPLVIITNKPSAFTNPILEKLAIRQYFRFVIGSDSGFPLKPAPAAILKIMAETGVSREHAAIVGDGTTDVLAGKAAGITACAVTYGYRTEQELREAGADYTIHVISDLQGLFEPEK